MDMMLESLQLMIEPEGMSMQTWNRHYPLTQREKPLVALRLYYRSGYSGYFVQQCKRLLAGGYSLIEIYSVSVDDGMRKWIEDAFAQK